MQSMYKKTLFFSDDYQVSHKTGDAYTYILITFSDQYTHTFTQSHTPASEGHQRCVAVTVVSKLSLNTKHITQTLYKQ